MKKNAKEIKLRRSKEEEIEYLLQQRNELLNSMTDLLKQKEILSAKETMKLLDISRNTFDRYRKQGILKTYKLNKKLYCKYSEIMAVLDKGIQDVA